LFSVDSLYYSATHNHKMNTSSSSTLLLLCYYLLKKQRNKRKRLYMTRSTLVDPFESPWRFHLQNGNDMTFTNAVGFTREVFFQLGEEISKIIQIDETKAKRNAYDILGLTLQHLVNCNQHKDLQQIFGRCPASISDDLYIGLDALLDVCRSDPRCAIEWPTPTKMEECSTLIYNKWGVKNCFGFMDGVYWPMYAPTTVEDQQQFYNGWKGDYTVTNVLVFLPDGTICHANFNQPGSLHDSTLAQPAYRNLLDLSKTPAKFRLLADSAFNACGNKILKPFKQGQRLSKNSGARKRQLLRNAIVIQARQAAEWGMRALQSVFRRLSHKLKFDKTYNKHLIELVLRLYNLRTRTMDRNQIKTVYKSVLEVVQEDINNGDYELDVDYLHQQVDVDIEQKYN